MDQATKGEDWSREIQRPQDLNMAKKGQNTAPAQEQWIYIYYIYIYLFFDSLNIYFKNWCLKYLFFDAFNIFSTLCQLAGGSLGPYVKYNGWSFPRTFQRKDCLSNQNHGQNLHVFPVKWFQQGFKPTSLWNSEQHSEDNSIIPGSLYTAESDCSFLRACNPLMNGKKNQSIHIEMTNSPFAVTILLGKLCFCYILQTAIYQWNLANHITN